MSKDPAKHMANQELQFEVLKHASSVGVIEITTQPAETSGNEWGPFGKLGYAHRPHQLVSQIHCPIVNQILGQLGKKLFALTLPLRLINLCSAIRATLGQRQIRQSTGLALNAGPFRQ